MTVILVIWIVLIIWLIIHSGDVEEILANSRQEMVDKHQEAYKKGLTVLLIFGVVLAIGIITYCTADLTEMKSVHTWLLGDIKRERWTTDHYAAFFCTLIGATGTLIGAVKSHRHNSKFNRYNAMTDSEYYEFQVETKKKDEEEEKQMKAVSRGIRIGKKVPGIIELLLNLFS